MGNAMALSMTNRQLRVYHTYKVACAQARRSGALEENTREMMVNY